MHGRRKASDTQTTPEEFISLLDEANELGKATFKIQFGLLREMPSLWTNFILSPSRKSRQRKAVDQSYMKVSTTTAERVKWRMG
jgi:hypothetical protein